MWSFISQFNTEHASFKALCGFLPQSAAQCRNLSLWQTAKNITKLSICALLDVSIQIKHKQRRSDGMSTEVNCAQQRPASKIHRSEISDPNLDKHAVLEEIGMQTLLWTHWKLSGASSRLLCSGGRRLSLHVHASGLSVLHYLER